MPPFPNSFDAYLAQNPTILMDSKQGKVAAASEQKQQSIPSVLPNTPTPEQSRISAYIQAAARDAGVDDSAPMNIDEILALATNPNLHSEVAGNSDYMRDASASRDAYDVMADSAGSAMDSFIRGWGSIASFGLGGVDAALGTNMGTDLAQGIQRRSQEFQETQSYGVQARRRANAARNAATSDRNQRLADDESDFLSGLRREGRNAIDAIKNLDLTNLTDISASGVGSLFGGGIAAKGLKTVGFGRAAMPVAIGSLEGGAAYEQTVNEMLDRGFSEEEANQAGLIAAGIQAPVGAITSKLVPFETAPFAVGSVRSAASNILREAVEEGIQSGSGQFAQNTGIAAFDPNQSLLEGVGEQAGIGAVAGVGTAGAAQAPGAALRGSLEAAGLLGDAVVGGTKAVINPVLGAITARAENIREANRKASPVAAENVRQVVDTAVAEAPVIREAAETAIMESDLPDDAKAEVISRLDNLISSSAFDPAELGEVSTTIQEAMADVTDRFGAVHKLGELVYTLEEGSPEQLEAAGHLIDAVKNTHKLIEESKLTTLESIPAEHPAFQMVQDFSRAMQAIGTTDKISKALEQVAKITESAKVEPEAVEDVSTPEARRAVKNAVLIASQAPLNSNPDTVEKILMHASNGGIELLPEQVAALRMSAAAVRGHREHLEKLIQQGLATEQDRVTGEVLTERNGKGKISAAQHMQRITNAMLVGDVDTAREYLKDFALFGQHMQNKVAALNEHLKQGTGNKSEAVPYQALKPDRTWADTGVGAGMWVNPLAAKSVRLAQQVGTDAATLGQLVNEMVSIFPDLGVEPLKLTELDASLTADTAEEIVQATKEAKKNRRSSTEPQANEAEGQPKGGDPVISAEATDPVETGPVAEAVEDVADSTEVQDVEKVVEPEQGTEPEQSQEPEPVEPAVEPTEDIEQSEPEPTPEPEAREPLTFETAFPNLRKNSLFRKVFRLPKEPRTRVAEVDSPLATIRDALASPSTLSSFLGSDTKHGLTDRVAEGYQWYFKTFESIPARLEAKLQDALAKMEAKDRLGDLSDDQKMRYARYRMFSLTDETNGKVTFNQKLIETATLAGLQWLLVASRYQSEKDVEGLSKILSLGDVRIEQSLVDVVNNGLTSVEAVRSLADTIKRYWGVSESESGYKGQIDGLAESMAGELLEVFENGKALSTRTVHVINRHGLTKAKHDEILKKLEGTNYTLSYVDMPEQNPGIYRSLNVHTPVTKAAPNKTHILQDPDHPVYVFADAIEQAVMLDPVKPDFIGEAPTEVASTQLHTPEVKLSSKTRKAMRIRQNTPHYANLTWIELVEDLDLGNLLELFGGGDLSRPLNENHKKSLEGKNLTIASGWDALKKTIGRVRAKAEQDGLEVDQVPVFYAREMTNTNRMMQVGGNTPQSSKIMREAFMPTRSTIDLSSETGAGYQAFMQALGQAVGVKIHDLTIDQLMTRMDKLLGENGNLLGSVQIFRDWLNSRGAEKKVFSPEDIQTLKSELGTDTTPVATLALLEYARFLNMKEAGEDLSSFTTSLYVEADGRTNGPANAMQLLTTGQYTVDQIVNGRKGGLFPGSLTTTMNERTGDRRDLYKTVSDLLTGIIAKDRSSPAIRQQRLTVLRLMNHLFGKDVVFNPEKGTFEFDRGVSKNPLTITIYGSGEKGIAGNFAEQMTKLIYEKMSDAMQLKAQNEGMSDAMALFPDSVDEAQATERAGNFFNAIKSLRDTQFVWDRPSKQYVLKPNADPKRNEGTSLEKLTISPFEMANIQSNILHTFVKPLRAAIEQTVGAEVINSANELRRATQAQSIVLGSYFRRKVDEMVAAKKTVDPDWVKEDFLTKNDLVLAWRSLAPLSPIIESPDQSWYLASGQRSDLVGTEFGKTLSGRFGIAGSVNAPGNAGVSGIPAMVIGAGDGLMMLELALDEELAARTLDIYDGLNMPLDAVVEFSQKANQAVSKSWQGNPLRAVSNAFSTFLENVSLDDMTPAEMLELTKALTVPFAKKPLTKEQLDKELRTLGPVLENMADSVDKRHAAMAKTNHTVDQMAGVGAPYVNEGTVSLEGLSDAQIARALNDLMVEKVSETEAEPEIVSENIAPELETVGRKLKSGARKIGFDGVRKLVRKLNVPVEQKEMLADILRTLVTREYTVVYGTPEQVRAYAQERDLQSLEDSTYRTKKVHGFVSPDDKTIYLHNPTSETLLHELIHAAVMDKILAYYAGESLGRDAVEQVKAIGRIEALMEQFLNLDITDEDALVQKAHADLVAEIEHYRMKGNEAAALNEFIAWSLSNSDLAGLQQRTQASPLVRLAQEVIAFLKRLVWGRKKMPKPGNDMLSNLRFNTEILMQSRLDPRTEIAQTIHFHSKRYGSDARLTEINETLNQAVFQHLSTEVEKRYGEKPVEARKAIIERGIVWFSQLTDMATVAADYRFRMTPQQATTYNLIVATMMTATKLDSNALARVQDLYNHVTKVLTPEHFMADPESTDPAARLIAERKFDFVMGQSEIETDAGRRSTLLPNFLALAVTVPEFRSILSTIEPPKAEKGSTDTLDAKVSNAANSILDEISLRLSGDSKHSTDVQASIDALMNQVLKVAQDRKSMIEQVTAPAGDFIDTANKWAVQGIQTLADKSEKAAEKLKERDDLLSQTAGKLLSGVGGVLDREVGGRVGEGLMSFVNRSDIPEALAKLLNDVVGRTDSNASIYDLIKQVRNWVEQRRQQFRERLPAMLLKQFSRKLTDQERHAMFVSMAKTDLAALSARFTENELILMVQEPTTLAAYISTLESELNEMEPAHAAKIQEKAKQLAVYMNTGHMGKNLLSNAKAVAHLLNEGVVERGDVTQQTIDLVDQLVSLYAFDGAKQESKDQLAELARTEPDGVKFMLAYLGALRSAELQKADSGRASFNHYKGKLPNEDHKGGTLIIASDLRGPELLEQSYVRVGDYHGSALDISLGSKGYYYAAKSNRAPYMQGIMHNVRQTAFGVDPVTGYSHELTAGRIEHPGEVKKITKRLHRINDATNENLKAIFDLDGNVVAYERGADPAHLQLIEQEVLLDEALGLWHGRQFEELESRKVNELLIDRLAEMHQKDADKGPLKQREYLNLFDPKVLEANPVLADSVKLLTPQTLDYIQQKFGNEFMVRKDLVEDSLGYRMPSISDAWSGVTHWPQEVQQAARNVAVAAFGNNGYRYLVQAEKLLQGAATEARTLIAIKSVIVPVANLMANVYQLWGRGVPLANIVRGMTRKTADVNTYLKGRLRLDEAEAELFAAQARKDSRAVNRLETEIQAIQDSQKRLSIWPLIEAGELSSISDGMVSREELELTDGRFQAYIEKLVDRLPAGAKDAARYAMIARDTPLFQGLQKVVMYGDFLGKAVLFDELTNRKKMTSKDALAIITDEFVNYDRLPGRLRGYGESIGAIWFWNFKIRSIKVGLSMLRNNPVHSLLAMAVPHPTWFGEIGSPIIDNALAMGLNDELGRSIGPGMGLDAWQLNPWVNVST